MKKLAIFSLIIVIGLLCFGLAAYPGLAVDTTEISDLDIVMALRTQLQQDEIISDHLIDLSVDAGIVTLAGTVDHLLAKERAAEIAEQTKGVFAVENELTVKPVLRSDTELREHIDSALAVDPATESFEIDMEVNAGIVTLSGTVESLAEYELTEDAVKRVAGVVHVQNNLKIVYPETRPDSEIATETEQRLELDPQIDARLLSVTVQNGNATLTGIVGSVAEKREAARAAWASGAQSVDTDDVTIDWRIREERRRQYDPVIRNDSAIQQAVENALFFEPRVTASDVHVSVENGEVTLSGVVEDYSAKLAAERAADNVPDVWRVNNYLVVRTETPASDDQILQDVRNALMRDPLVNRFNIEVSVLNGRVYLRGIVDTFAGKRQAEDVASRVKSVVDVQNSLKVDTELTWKDDETIREDIHSEYFWSLLVDGSDITVSVENGKAKLFGRVDNWNEHRYAVDNAFEAGATAVISYLEIATAPWSQTPRFYNQAFYEQQVLRDTRFVELLCQSSLPLQGEE